MLISIKVEPDKGDALQLILNISAVTEISLQSWNDETVFIEVNSNNTREIHFSENSKLAQEFYNDLLEMLTFNKDIIKKRWEIKKLHGFNFIRVIQAAKETVINLDNINFIESKDQEKEINFHGNGGTFKIPFDSKDSQRDFNNMKKVINNATGFKNVDRSDNKN